LAGTKRDLGELRFVAPAGCWMVRVERTERPRQRVAIGAEVPELARALPTLHDVAPAPHMIRAFVPLGDPQQSSYPQVHGNLRLLRLGKQLALLRLRSRCKAVRRVRE